MADALRDWEAILDVRQRPVGLADDPAFVWDNPSTLRREFVELDQSVVDALAARAERSLDPVAIHAAVVRVTGPLVVPVRSLTVHTAILEVGAGASLDIVSGRDDDPTVGVAITAGEIHLPEPGATLPLTVGGFTHPMTAITAGGTLEATVAADGSVTITELPEPHESDRETAQVLVTLAKRLGYRPAPELPDRLGVRLADWVAASAGDVLLATEARLLTKRLDSSTPDRHHVPLLPLDDYGRLAQVTVEALAAVEDGWERLVDQQVTKQARQDAANDLLRQYRNALAYTTTRLDAVSADVEAARSATVAAQGRVVERRGELDDLKRAFEEGVEAKRRQLRDKAIWEGILGVVTVGAAVAATVATAGAAAPAAGAAAAATAKTAADTVSTMQRLVELIRKIGEMLDFIKTQMERLQKLVELLDKLAEPGKIDERMETIAQAVAEADDADEATMSNADWEEFLAELEIAFGPAIDAEIDGAPDYLLALQKLAIRGRDLIATQGELVRSSRELQVLLWERLRDESDIEIMEQRIEQLDDSVASVAPLMVFHTQLRDRLRFRIVGTIDDMADAFRYRTLREPRFVPSMSATNTELKAMLSDALAAVQDAREDEGQRSRWNDQIIVSTDSPVLADAEPGARRLSITVPVDDFDEYDRIRVEDIRVWTRADGDRDRITTQIFTSGEYTDRAGSELWDFSTKPLFWSFTYRHDARGDDEDWWDRPIRIINTATDGRDDFFQPSLFTTWTVDFPQLSKLTLSDAREIVIDFHGTVTNRRLTFGSETVSAKGPASGPVFGLDEGAGDDAAPDHPPEVPGGLLRGAVVR